MERVRTAMPRLYPQLLLEGTPQGNCWRVPRVPRLWFSDEMIMYSTYYSIVKAAVSVVAPNEAPEVDKEKESSDYKCALCEQFKDNPNP